MLEFGTTEAGIRSIIEIPAGDEKRKSVSQAAHDLQVRQTHGEDLRHLGMHISETLRATLFANGQSAESVVWLKSWAATSFIKAGQRAYFGDTLEAIDPDLPSVLMEMDDLSWQIFYKYPKVFRPRLQRLCDRILAALRQYLAIPMADRQASAWFTSSLEHEYRVAGLSEEDMATQLLFLYWGINTNTSKIVFWVIVHLLQKPDLVQQIRQETAPAFDADGQIDADFVQRYCPALNAVWLEALRLSAASTAIRSVTQDFMLGDKTLRAGNQVLVSARQLHLRRQDFGECVDQFDHERWLRKPSLERSAAFRPFGGGPTMCPGRLLAKHMTLGFVARLYRDFDVTLDGPQEWPKYEEAKPSIGIVGGQGDVRVRLSPRPRSQL